MRFMIFALMKDVKTFSLLPKKKIFADRVYYIPFTEQLCGKFEYSTERHGTCHRLENTSSLYLT